MSETIGNFIVENLGEFGVFLCSMIPVIELRGAIPLGFGIGMPWWLCYIVSVIGNMIPVPFILLFINRFVKWLAGSKVGFFNKVAAWLLRKVDKNREKIEKFGFWGLVLFVAIPLPGTGAWTGSLVSACIDMKFWKGLLSAFIGVLGAGAIMTIISYVGIGGIVAAFRAIFG